MPGLEGATRINLLEFQRGFEKILGPAKFFKYRSLLWNFLSFKLTKAKLDELVPMAIGKENVALHNQFMRTIYFNATCCNAPAPPASLNALSPDTSSAQKNHDVKILDSRKTGQAKKIVGPESLSSGNTADQESRQRCPKRVKIVGPLLQTSKFSGT